MGRLWMVAGVVAFLGACGGDTTAPRLIAGGGVGDGAIDGELNIHVIDLISGSPVAGAEVLVGADRRSTNASGLATFSSDSLSGPQTVTAVASGYAVATWYGVNGANATIPVSPADPVRAVPTLQISGTIAGWSNLPTPEPGHYLAAAVHYTLLVDMTSPANNIAQEMTGGIFDNVCLATGAPTECSWTLTTRTGPQAIYALVVDANDEGTPLDRTDDTVMVIGFAYKRGLVGEQGVDQTGVALTLLTDLPSASITFEPFPAGFSVIGVGGLRLSDEGAALVDLVATPSSPTLSLPALQGPFADASYWVVGTASPEGQAAFPIRRTFERNVVDLNAVSVGGGFMQEPPELSLVGGEYSIGPSPDASLRIIELGAPGDTAWQVTLLDGRTAFTLPTVAPDPLPLDSVDALVTAFDVTMDAEDFSLRAVLESVDRLSMNKVTITR